MNSFGTPRSPAPLPAFRRFSRTAWLLHGYLMASLILLPVSTFSYGQEADPPPAEEPSAPTPEPDPAPTPEEPPPPPDPAVTDSDGDLLSNEQEAALGSDPYNPDSDYDGITDADEVQITGTSPVAVDTDGDGVSDFNEFYGNYTVDTDVSGDGSAPYDWDGDGYEDPIDPDPLSTTNDPDSDGDYVQDSQDSHPWATWLWCDWNNNGVNDDVETNDPNPDHDGDGVANESDSHPWDASLYNDWNWNNVNDQDEDWDGDGVTNLQDSHPNSNVLWCDWDQDGTNDDVEWQMVDSDGDNYSDGTDTHPWDANLWNDHNQNGINDDAEQPNDPSTMDSDNDGTVDSQDSHPNDVILQDDWNYNGINDSSEPPSDGDLDDDGVADEADTHPDNSALWEDYDNDGVNDSSMPPVDSDGDGVGDNDDTHPQDSSRSRDYDDDGVDDDAPPQDSDGDSHTDEFDSHPGDPNLWNDQNNNGTNDETEVVISDQDADGYADELDTHPQDAALWNDHNTDGINDELQTPPDSDNDGIPDSEDNYPHDFDNDGIDDITEINNGTDPAVPDTDSDGLSDGEEAYAGTNPSNVDSDGDGLTDNEELEGTGTDPNGGTILTETQSQADSINTQAEATLASESTSSATSTSTAPSPPLQNTIVLNGIYTAFANVAASLQDTDGDRIPDCVEDMYAPLMDKKNPRDANGDLDYDGMDNIAEFNAGYDLRGRFTPGADFDGDTISNIVEDKYSTVTRTVVNPQTGMATTQTVAGPLNRFRASDAVEDYDGDGLLNVEEARGKWHVGRMTAGQAIAKGLTSPAAQADAVVAIQDDLFSDPTKRQSCNVFIDYGTQSNGFSDGGRVPTDRVLHNALFLTYASNVASLRFHVEGWSTSTLAKMAMRKALRLGLAVTDNASRIKFEQYFATFTLAQTRSFYNYLHVCDWVFLKYDRLGDVDLDSMPDAWEHAYGLAFRWAGDAGPGLRALAQLSTTPPPRPPATYKDSDRKIINGQLETDEQYNARLELERRAYQIKVNIWQDWLDRGKRDLVDSDGDRVSNLAEYINGSNPLKNDYAIPWNIQIADDLTRPLSEYYQSFAEAGARRNPLIRPEITILEGRPSIDWLGVNAAYTPLTISVRAVPTAPQWQWLADTTYGFNVKLSGVPRTYKDPSSSDSPAVEAALKVGPYPGHKTTSWFMTKDVPYAFAVFGPGALPSWIDRDIFTLKIEAKSFGVTSTMIVGPYRVGTMPTPLDEYLEPSEDYLASPSFSINTATVRGGVEKDFGASYEPLELNMDSSWPRPLENSGHPPPGPYENSFTILSSNQVRDVLWGRTNPPAGAWETFGGIPESLTNSFLSNQLSVGAHVSQSMHSDGRLNFVRGSWNAVWLKVPAVRLENPITIQRSLPLWRNTSLTNNKGETTEYSYPLATVDFIIQANNANTIPDPSSPTGQIWLAKSVVIHPQTPPSDGEYPLSTITDPGNQAAGLLITPAFADNLSSPGSRFDQIGLLPVELKQKPLAANGVDVEGGLQATSSVRYCRWNDAWENNGNIKANYLSTADIERDGAVFTLPDSAFSDSNSQTKYVKVEIGGDETTLELSQPAGSTEWQSQSFIVVCDDPDDTTYQGPRNGVADNAIGDRTIMGQPGAAVHVTVLKNDRSTPIFPRTEVAKVQQLRREIKCRLFALTADGAVGPGDQQVAAESWPTTQEVWAQAGINARNIGAIQISAIRTPPEYWAAIQADTLSVSTLANVDNNGYMLRFDAWIDRLDTGADDVKKVIYVPTSQIQRPDTNCRGYARQPGRIAVVCTNFNTYDEVGHIAAHELGHCINLSHCQDEANPPAFAGFRGLMTGSNHTAPRIRFDDQKRIFADQQLKAYQYLDNQ